MITEASVRLGMARVVVASTYYAMPGPSMIVHHVGSPSGSLMGFQLLCVRPIGSFGETSTYHARVLTEVNSIGRSLQVHLTRDPVDCMSCLVAQARR